MENMKKEDFLKFLQRSSPEEVRDFVMKEGKKKFICPFIQYPEGTKWEDVKDKL